MKLAARAREQRMHEAAEELRRKLRSLRTTTALIEAVRPPGTAAEEARPADPAPEEVPPAPAVAQPAPPPSNPAPPTSNPASPTSNPASPTSNQSPPPSKAADSAPKPRPKPQLNFVRRNLNKFSREAFMAEYEAMRERDRSGS